MREREREREREEGLNYGRRKSRLGQPFTSSSSSSFSSSSSDYWLRNRVSPLFCRLTFLTKEGFRIRVAQQVSPSHLLRNCDWITYTQSDFFGNRIEKNRHFFLFQSITICLEQLLPVLITLGCVSHLENEIIKIADTPRKREREEQLCNNLDNNNMTRLVEQQVLGVDCSKNWNKFSLFKSSSKRVPASLCGQWLTQWFVLLLTMNVCQWLTHEKAWTSFTSFHP